MESSVEALSFLNIPRIKLPVPTLRKPSALVVFCILFASYFLVLSGIIYDVVQEPPSIGVMKDPATGKQKPVAFLQNRINGQYIIEGLSAGLLFVIGGTGFIFLDRASDANTLKRNRYLFAFAGFLMIVIAYALCLVFIRIKIPGY